MQIQELIPKLMNFSNLELELYIDELEKDSRKTLTVADLRDISLSLGVCERLARSKDIRSRCNKLMQWINCVTRGLEQIKVVAQNLDADKIIVFRGDREMTLELKEVVK